MSVASAFRGRRVLITGHTGFKGGWLALWLQREGAEVSGLALAPPTAPSLYELAGVGSAMRIDERVDVRDLTSVERVMQQAAPEVVFHMAAQPLVRHSYREPVETFATNVMGTVHVLDAARRVPSVRAVVVVTSDKCYENREWPWGYRETEAMGGHDPYAASKGCAELVTSAFARSYFSTAGPAVASVRAGNVIGGGDWAQDRLVPDAMRAFVAGAEFVIRNPNAVRPWQHVLEPLRGYLMVAARLLNGAESSASYNFGPGEDDARPVGEVIEKLVSHCPGGRYRVMGDAGPHEAHLLRLDCARARTELGWRPALPLDEALAWTAAWYRDVARGEDARALTLAQIAHYEALVPA